MVDSAFRVQRRLVTAHRDGKSVVLSDQRRPAYSFKTVGGFEHTYIWATNGALEADPEQAERVVHVVTFPPAVARASQVTDPAAVAQEYLARLPGLAETFEHDGSEMHVTLTIDYALILEGDLWLELDDGETAHFTAGDIVVQQATRHGWRNKGQRSATIAFVALGAEG